MNNKTDDLTLVILSVFMDLNSENKEKAVEFLQQMLAENKEAS